MGTPPVNVIQSSVISQRQLKFLGHDTANILTNLSTSDHISNASFIKANLFEPWQPQHR